jgi:hypothetical protein
MISLYNALIDRRETITTLIYNGQKKKEKGQTTIYKTLRRLFIHIVNKRKRIPKGQSKMDNPDKLVTQSTEDEEN